MTSELQLKRRCCCLAARVKYVLLICLKKLQMSMRRVKQRGTTFRISQVSRSHPSSSPHALPVSHVFPAFTINNPCAC